MKQIMANSLKQFSKRIELLHNTRYKRFFLGAVPLASFLIVSLGTAGAATTRTYMQIYSEAGTYSHVTIKLIDNTSSPDDSHYCGGALTSTNSHTVTKRLTKYSPLRVSCSAVDGTNLYYKVSYFKGRSSTPVRVHPTVNVDSGKCTVIHPATPAFLGSTANTCPPISDTISAKHNVVSRTCLKDAASNCVSDVSNVSALHGVTGIVTLKEDVPVDGDSNMSKNFCIGKVQYTYHNNAKNTDQGPYYASLRFKISETATSDYCAAKIGHNSSKLNLNTSYTVTAQYNVTNIYLNQPSASTATFTTKK